jgi:hypothetical protein
VSEDYKTVIQYPNISGATVDVVMRIDRPEFRAECTGCLATSWETETPLVSMEPGRLWAEEHSLKCRALPLGDETGETEETAHAVKTEQYAARSAELVERAMKLLSGRADVTEFEGRDRRNSAELSLKAAQVYATLARS